MARSFATTGLLSWTLLAFACAPSEPPPPPEPLPQVAPVPPCDVPSSWPTQWGDAALTRKSHATLASPPSVLWRVDTGGQANLTTLMRGGCGLVAAGFGDTVRVFRADGTLVWERKLGTLSLGLAWDVQGRLWTSDGGGRVRAWGAGLGPDFEVSCGLDGGFIVPSSTGPVAFKCGHALRVVASDFSDVGTQPADVAEVIVLPPALLGPRWLWLTTKRAYLLPLLLDGPAVEVALPAALTSFGSAVSAPLGRGPAEAWAGHSSGALLRFSGEPPALSVEPVEATYQLRALATLPSGGALALHGRGLITLTATGAVEQRYDFTAVGAADQLDPILAVDAEGTAVVVWKSGTGSATRRELVAVRDGVERWRLDLDVDSPVTGLALGEDGSLSVGGVTRLFQLR